MKNRARSGALTLAVLAAASGLGIGPADGVRPVPPRIASVAVAGDVALGGRPTSVAYAVVLTRPAQSLEVVLLDGRGRAVSGVGMGATPGVSRFAGSISVDATQLPQLTGAHWVFTVDGPGGRPLASKRIAVRFRARGLVGIGGHTVNGAVTLTGVARRWSVRAGRYVPYAGQPVEIGFMDGGVLDAFRYVRTDDAGRLATDVTGLHGTFVLVLPRSATVAGSHSTPLKL